MEIPTRDLIVHVESLTAAFNIEVVFNDLLRPHEARAIVLGPYKAVEAPPIRCEANYAVVMHECGHHLAPNGYCWHPKPKIGCHRREVFAYWAAKLTAEEAAWEWARYYITQRFPWTASMEHVFQFACGTYREARRTGFFKSPYEGGRP